MGCLCCPGGHSRDHFSVMPSGSPFYPTNYGATPSFFFSFLITLSFEQVKVAAHFCGGMRGSLTIMEAPENFKFLLTLCLIELVDIPLVASL